MAHHNPIVICPYNRAHLVPTLRMQIHLIKCRKNYPEWSRLMKVCPFNATHIMPELELPDHLMSCPNRCLIEGQKYNINEDHGDLGNPTYHPNVPVEDWDDLNVHRSFRLCNPYPTLNEQLDEEYKDMPDQTLPGGALGTSSEGFERTPNLMGLGRGRIYSLLANMKSENSSS